MARRRRRLVGMEGLRVEGRGEALDLLRREGVRAEVGNLSDHDILEEHHGRTITPAGAKA